MPDDEVAVSALVEQARESIAAYANATLTLTFWRVGRLIDTEVLASERAGLRHMDVAGPRRSVAKPLRARYRDIRLILRGAKSGTWLAADPRHPEEAPRSCGWRPR